VAIGPIVNRRTSKRDRGRVATPLQSTMRSAPWRARAITTRWHSSTNASNRRRRDQSPTAPMSTTNCHSPDRAKLRDLIAIKGPADIAVLTMLVVITVIDIVDLVGLK
jgi:hypothetical protein